MRYRGAQTALIECLTTAAGPRLALSRIVRSVAWSWKSGWSI